MFGTSSFSPGAKDLESLVRIALQNRELAPGVAAQIDCYRTGRATCEEQRLLAVLDDAIAHGCVVPVELTAVGA